MLGFHKFTFNCQISVFIFLFTILFSSIAYAASPAYQCLNATTGNAKKPVCPAGFSLNDDQNLCHKPSVPVSFTKNSRPKGDWKPHHNTSKYFYRARGGRDAYTKDVFFKDTVGLKCKGNWPNKFDYGEYAIDHEGRDDWCVTKHPYVSPQSVTATCNSPNRFRLVRMNVSESGAITADTSAVEIFQRVIGRHTRTTNGKTFINLKAGEGAVCKLGDRSAQNVAHIDHTVKKTRKDDFKEVKAVYAPTHWVIGAYSVILEHFRPV